MSGRSVAVRMRSLHPGAGVHGQPEPTMSRILIIDDDEMVRESIAMLLQLRGWETDTAGEGQAGLEAARRQRPDLILCDVNMPVMDGLEMLAEVRCDPQLQSVPVLMITGRCGEEGAHPALRRGAQGVLVKPFGSTELLAAIHLHLRPARDLG